MTGSVVDETEDRKSLGQDCSFIASYAELPAELPPPISRFPHPTESFEDVPGMIILCYSAENFAFFTC